MVLRRLYAFAKSGSAIPSAARSAAQDLRTATGDLSSSPDESPLGIVISLQCQRNIWSNEDLPVPPTPWMTRRGLGREDDPTRSANTARMSSRSVKYEGR